VSKETAAKATKATQLKKHHAQN